MPAGQSDAAREELARDLVTPRPTRRDLGGGPPGSFPASGIVVPYDVSETGTTLFSALCGLRPSAGFMPRETVPPMARAMITVAHEMAHSFHDALGFRYGTVAEMHAAECFADAVAIVAYVLETGDEASAAAWARVRALAALGGHATHATGPACMAAIVAVAALREAHPGRAVPLDEVLAAACRIAAARAHPEPDDIAGFGAAFAGLDPAWGDLDGAGIRDLADLAVRGSMLADPDATAVFAVLAVDALSLAAFTPRDLAAPGAVAAAVAVERSDIRSSLSRLGETGMGGIVPAVFDRLAATLVPPADPSSAPRAGVGRRLAAAGRRLRPGAPAESPPAVLSRARRAAIVSARLAWAGTRRRKAVPAGAVSLLPCGQGGPGSMFDATVGTRMRRIGELAGEVLRSLPGPAAPAVQVELAALAWTVRADPDIWSALVAARGEKACSAIRDIALCGSVPVPPSRVRGVHSRMASLASSVSEAEDLALHELWIRGEPGGRRLDWSGRDVRWMDIRGMDIRGADLSGADLSGMDLTARDFTCCILVGTRLDGATVSRCRFDRADMRDATMDGATGVRVSMAGVDIRGVSGRRAALVETDFSGSSAAGSRFPGARLGAGRFDGSDGFGRAELAGADTGGSVGLERILFVDVPATTASTPTRGP